MAVACTGMWLRGIGHQPIRRLRPSLQLRLDAEVRAVPMTWTAGGSCTGSLNKHDRLTRPLPELHPLEGCSVGPG